MQTLIEFATDLDRFVPLLATILVVTIVLSLMNRTLRRRWKDQPDAQFKFQMIMMLSSFVALLMIVVALPISDALQSQLLSLIGLLLSAAIALSSTTFIGNIMAGIMLKVIRSTRPGDWITLGDITGRVTEMDLLHTEIQTEYRDLVTVPNLSMVTQPLHVVRASGTVISAEVSLGYDIPHQKVRQSLSEAAERAGLTDVFVHVRELGDFSVQYKVAGLLTDVSSLISARSSLRTEMLDCLHHAGIEIVSPSFMNQRPQDTDKPVIPVVARTLPDESAPAAEAVIFDKAASAATIESVKQSIEAINKQIEAAVDDGGLSDDELEELQFKKDRLITDLAHLESRHEQE
ncbi:MAG: mechanosensitive ion channel family protein [Pseudomonadota bacterium]